MKKQPRIIDYNYQFEVSVYSIAGIPGQVKLYIDYFL